MYSFSKDFFLEELGEGWILFFQGQKKKRGLLKFKVCGFGMSSYFTK